MAKISDIKKMVQQTTQQETQQKTQQPADDAQHLLEEDVQLRYHIKHDFSRSYFVEASAGAGKTRCLVDRMIHLMVGKKVMPSAIVAITFTNKAADELRERLEEEVSRLLSSKDEELKDAGFTNFSLEERNHLETAYNNLDQCFMGTIHSFCARLLASRPVEAGLPLVFEKMEEEENEACLYEYWHEYIKEQCEKNENLKILQEMGVPVHQYSNDFIKLNTYRELLPVQYAENEPSTDEGLFLTNEDWTSIREDVREMQTLGLFRSSASNTLRIETIQHITHKHLKGIEPNVYEKVRLLDSLISLSIIWDKSEMNEVSNRSGIRLEQVEQKIHQFKERYNKRGRYTRMKNQYAKQVYFPLFRVLEDAVLQSAKQRILKGNLNFHDLLVETRNLLNNSEEARRSLQSTYQYFFIDEFQDTDPLQTDIIQLLVQHSPHPDALYIVGDKKQSIYRFKRADITNFNRVQAEVQQNRPPAILHRNFRSVPVLCNWFNEQFQRIFDVRDSNTTQARYSKMISGRENELEMPTQDCFLEGAYALHYRPQAQQPDESDFRAKVHANSMGNAQEAAEVVRKMMNLKKVKVGSKKDKMRIITAGSENLFDNAVDMEYSDFLVVTYNKYGIENCINAFRSQGIPVKADGENYLRRCLWAEELVLLLESIAEPEDSLRTLAALRSPVFGLTDNEINAHAQKNSDPWVFVNRSKPWESTSTVTENLQRMEHWVHKKHQHLPVVLLDQLVEELNILPLINTLENGETTTHLLLQMIELLRIEEMNGQTKDINNLVQRMRRYLKKNLERQMPLDPEESAVRIMNLHKAKGLEAPVVILMDEENQDWMNRHQVYVEQPRLFFSILHNHSSYNSAVPGHPPEWTGHFSNEKDMALEENTRKLYVAATRTENVLLISQKEPMYPLKFNDKSIWAELFGTPNSRANLNLNNNMIPKIQEQSFYKTIEPLNKAVVPCSPKAVQSDLAQLNEKIQQDQKHMRTSKYLHVVPSSLTPQNRFYARHDVDEQDGDVAHANPHGNLWGTLVHSMLENLVNNRKTIAQIDLPDLAFASLARVWENIIQDRESFQKLQQTMGTHEVEETQRSLRSKLVEVAESFMEMKYRQPNSEMDNLWEQILAAEEVYTELPFSVKSKKGEALFELCSKALGELPGDAESLESTVEEMIISGTMDLVFKTENGWVIVDYKTGSMKDVDGSNDPYRYQLMVYELIMEKLHGGDSRCSLYWINFSQIN